MTLEQAVAVACADDGHSQRKVEQMDIPLFSSGHDSNGSLFLMWPTFDVPGAQRVGDTTSLTVRFKIKRTSIWDNDRADRIPTLWHLGGDLFVGDDYRPAGASLIACDDLPKTFLTAATEVALDLTFRMSQNYVQYIEEQRVTSARDVQLRIHLWGIIAYSPPPTNSTQGVTTEIERIETYRNSPPSGIRIARSDWVETILPALGYPQERTFALPRLDVANVSNEIKVAVEQLDKAFVLFAQERYGEAVQHCRQVRDALLGSDKTTWSQRTLKPVMGSDKSMMVDDAIKALNHLGPVTK